MLTHNISLTRRLVESTNPSADINELAGVLRSICLASATITRVIKAHAFLANHPSGFYAEVDQAIHQVRLELGIDDAPEMPEASSPYPDP